MKNNNHELLKKKITELINSEEFSSDLTEISTSAGVSVPASKFAFSRKSGGNERAATNSTGYKIASTKRSKNFLKEDTDYNIKADYDAFVAKLKNLNFSLDQEITKKLNGVFANKQVVIHGSKGYKQFKKDYTIDVANVKVDDYYGNFEIIFVGKDGKEYFVDRSYKVKITTAGTSPTTDAEKPTDSQTNTQQPPAPTATPQTTSPAPAEPQTDLSKELNK